MAKNRKSESLFDNTELNNSKPTIVRRTPEEREEHRKKIEEVSSKDCIFRGELKKAFRSETELARSDSNLSIIKELEAIRENVSEKEMDVVVKANRRRKRHYLLNGDICVYCYVRNKWPKLIIRPLTIDLDKSVVPKIEGYDKKDEFVIKAKFSPITIGVRRKIDPYIFDQLDGDYSHASINFDEYKKLSFISCFKEWNLPIEVKLDDNRVSEESWEIIEKTIHPRLFDVLMGEFISLNEINEEELNILEQQCERLFSKNSKGVTNPIEGIRLYCEASVFAKEFHLSGKDLNSLSYRVASMMKYVSNKGNEIQIRQMDQSSKSSSKSAKSAKSGRK